MEAEKLIEVILTEKNLVRVKESATRSYLTR